MGFGFIAAIFKAIASCFVRVVAAPGATLAGIKALSKGVGRFAYDMGLRSFGGVMKGGLRLTRNTFKDIPGFMKHLKVETGYKFSRMGNAVQKTWTKYIRSIKGRLPWSKYYRGNNPGGAKYNLKKEPWMRTGNDVMRMHAAGETFRPPYSRHGTPWAPSPDVSLNSLQLEKLFGRDLADRGMGMEDASSSSSSSSSSSPAPDRLLGSWSRNNGASNITLWGPASGEARFVTVAESTLETVAAGVKGAGATTTAFMASREAVGCLTHRVRGASTRASECAAVCRSLVEAVDGFVLPGASEGDRIWCLDGEGEGHPCCVTKGAWGVEKLASPDALYCASGSVGWTGSLGAGAAAGAMALACY